MQLAELQLAILQALWSKLKAGGVLLYVTCSILPAENQGVVARFLEQQADAELDPIAVDWGIECKPGRQLLPSAGGSDGLYFARLKKTAPR